MKKLMQSLSAGIAGIVFGTGLIISGMNDPKKVQDFLDVSGDWDPSLAFVMVGAILVTTIGYRLLFRSAGPLFDDLFRLPVSTQIDRRLIGGAALFGIGWGLAGLCPGPAFVDFGIGSAAVTLFLIAMIISINLFRLVQTKN